MRRLIIAATVLGAALALPTLAAAKGPASASITGPGLSRSLAITGQGEGGTGTPLGALVDAGGFFPQMFGQTPDPTMQTRPKGTLGPRYRVMYIVPGPNSIQSRVAQDVYPYAKPTPLTYMKPGQVFWGGRKAHGGWFRASATLRTMLVRAGLPRTAPAQAGLGGGGTVGALAAVLSLLAVGTLLASARARRSQS